MSTKIEFSSGTVTVAAVPEGYPGSEAEKREAERAREAATEAAKAELRLGLASLEADRAGQAAAEQDAARRVGTATAALEAAWQAQQELAARNDAARAAMVRQWLGTWAPPPASQDAQNGAVTASAAATAHPSLERPLFQPNSEARLPPHPSGITIRTDLPLTHTITIDPAGRLGPIRWSALPDLLPGDRYAEHDPVPAGAVFVGVETWEEAEDRAGKFWWTEARGPSGQHLAMGANLVAVFRLAEAPGSVRLRVAAKPAGSIQFRPMEFFEVDPPQRRATVETYEAALDAELPSTAHRKQRSALVQAWLSAKNCPERAMVEADVIALANSSEIAPLTASADWWCRTILDAVRLGAPMRAAEDHAYAVAGSIGRTVDRAMVSAVRYALEQAAEAERRAALPDPAAEARDSRDAAVTRAVSRDAGRTVSGWGTP